MSSARDVLAEHARRLLLVAGVGLLVLGGVGPEPVGAVTVLGVVTLLAGLFLAEPVAELLRTGEPRPPADPVEALRERYARGEIDRAEFERRLERHLGADDDGGDAVEPETLRER